MSIKEIGLLCICLLLVACGTKNNVVYKASKCNAVDSPEEEVEKQYLHFIEDFDFCKNEFALFDKLKNGILLYSWQEGTGSNKFLIIDLDKDFESSIKMENYNKKIGFPETEKK